jgi:serine/threonine protein kinase
LFWKEIDIIRTHRHPLIASLYDVYDCGTSVELIYEYLDGGNLLSLVQSRNLVEKNAALVFSQLLEVMSFLHKQNVVHRDIKLENIMLV